jgi:hypothetical protein
MAELLDHHPLLGHLAEFGLFAEVGAFNVGRLVAAMHNQPESSIPGRRNKFFKPNLSIDGVGPLNVSERHLEQLPGGAAVRQPTTTDICGHGSARRELIVPSNA